MNQTVHQTVHQKATKTIDALGLECPEPLMLLHAALNDLAGGESVEIIGDDSASLRDMKKLCHFLKHRIVFELEQAQQYTLIIEKRAGSTIHTPIHSSTQRNNL